MKRILLLISVLFSFAVPALANHITGGEVYYVLVSQSGNEYTYRITLKLYRDHNSSGAQLDISAPIAIYDKLTGNRVWSNSIPKTSEVRLLLGAPDPCITNPPVVDYDVGFYTFEVTLQGSSLGYTISYQRCCRIAGINNLSGSNGVGATYSAEIPGMGGLSTAPANNSARFVGADTVVVCQNYDFCYNFGAIDPDPDDSLVYYFCTAFTGGSSGSPAPNPPSGPPFVPVPYSFPFKETSPLGDQVTIDPNTGMVCGTAPESGIYVVTVCVAEYREGVLIATQRKDLQIKVGDCDIASATLKPTYITCDGFTLTFENLSTSPLINSHYWEFGDPGSGVNNTSTLASPTHTFSDTGIYKIKLVTNRNQSCSDSATALVKVYPGFFPNFNTSGICYMNPVTFIDSTKTNYGVVNSWSWNFGDLNVLGDTSHIQNPQWTYGGPGTKTVQLIVTNSKGCIDTVIKNVDLLDKPPISLGFKDTLICVADDIQLQASGQGNFSWTPLSNITNPNTATPTVDPPVTTTYYVSLDNGGCINRDSVRVRVINVVTLIGRPDTTICKGDPAQLGAVTDGLQFSWTPAASLSNPNILSPIATPQTTTTYQLVATVGSCSASASTTVSVVPYPIANAGPDTTICYNTTGQLNGSHDGISFTWSPIQYLNNPAILNPKATPPRTTAFILSAFDNRGCPKPGRDTVIVTVLPKIKPFAGRDTSVIIGQPLQFNAEGGVNYLWTPPTGLSSTIISNPVGTYDGSIDTIRYMVQVFNEVGCSDSAFITVKVFKTNPTIFVPTGFTPNNDGRNDVVRPIAVGIQKINYFRIFNRWGQMVFSTSTNGHGWDGKIGGTLQGTNVFVWMVSAVDFLGKPYFSKGTVTLIR